MPLEKTNQSENMIPRYLATLVPGQLIKYTVVCGNEALLQ